MGGVIIDINVNATLEAFYEMGFPARYLQYPVNYNTDIKELVKEINKKSCDKEGAISFLRTSLRPIYTQIIWSEGSYILLTHNKKHDKSTGYFKYKINRQANGILLQHVDRKLKI